MKNAQVESKCLVFGDNARKKEKTLERIHGPGIKVTNRLLVQQHSRQRRQS